jgi:antitoxin (DNA-binding transcriptional repressor) of toxin-antitoxin stability system
MPQVNLYEARTQLVELIEEVASGEDVVIVYSDGTAFEVVQIESTRHCPVFGSAKGLIEMSDNFDDPLADFGDYAL